MQSRYRVDVTPAEWRWVIVVATLLVLVGFLPYLWVLLDNRAGTQWQFMGMLNNHRDGATYLSKMIQGVEGDWLIRFYHTPERHDGAFILVIYLLLGHVARLSSLPPIVVFHVARVGASLFMYMAIYYLAASIWMRLRARRVFFALAAVGSGFGWLLSVLTGETTFPDLTVPEAFPFYSSLVNVHFPLALACLALLASIIIRAFRPGADEEDPDVTNGGLAAIVLSVVLAILYPQALVPIGVGLGVYVVAYWLNRRHFTERPLRWWLVVVLPAVPMAAYYGAIVVYNPAVAEWNRQNVTSTPPPWIVLLGLGAPLIMALPGIYRAIRRFEPDGDQFMLIWLLTILVAIYLPINVQRRFAVGLMIPLAYFATRSLEDFWFRFVGARWRARLFVAAIPLIATSNLFVLLVPVIGIMTRPPQQTEGLILEKDYRAAFEWLEPRTTPNSVVLASPNVSLWLPGWAEVRPVYGHDFETLQAETKKQAVLAWYGGEVADCEALLNGAYAFRSTYRVRYVIWGPEERALGETHCLNGLELVARYGSVSIYEP